MANKELFKSTVGPATNAVNQAGAAAYVFTDEHALTQYAVTGCLNNTYYADAQSQMKEVLRLSKNVSDVYLAKLAIYTRKSGLMKDMPAMLLAILATRDVLLVRRIFPLVCDDAKMLKNFVQIIRSGVVGRRSFGTSLKKTIHQWFESRTDEQIFNGVVGNDPSMADVIKLTRPRPHNPTRAALYRFIIGAKLNEEQIEVLPDNVRRYIEFKNDPTGELPKVPFMLLTNLNLTQDHYKQMAREMSFSAIRQNINALTKHGVFKDPEVLAAVVDKLSSKQEAARAKTLPFQMVATYKAIEKHQDLPELLIAAQAALDNTLSNTPTLDVKAVVGIDVSGSMGSPITGTRGRQTSTTITCATAAAVMGSALLRKNPTNVTILPFAEDVRPMTLNPHDSVVTNTEKIFSRFGGGTSVSSVIAHLNYTKSKAQLVIIISDNESWIDQDRWGRCTTETVAQWKLYKKSNPQAKLVCIDIQPNSTSQTPNTTDTINIGGIGDSVFKIMEMFVNNDLTSTGLCDTVREVEI